MVLVRGRLIIANVVIIRLKYRTEVRGMFEPLHKPGADIFIGRYVATTI